MAMGNRASKKHKAEFRTTAMGRIERDHWQNHSSPCRARLWRHDPVLPLRTAGHAARRTRNFGGPKAVARADVHPGRRDADHLQGRPTARFRYALPIGSLPLVLGTRVETIPSRVPYLTPSGAHLEKWKRRLPASGGARRHQLGRQSEVPDRFQPLNRPAAAVATARADRGAIFRLTKRPARRKYGELSRQNPQIVYLGDEIQSFDDTAAIISLMDLVISSDTSIVHLAGALGKPTWVLLQFVPDWRWLLDRDDSPWYPDSPPVSAG